MERAALIIRPTVNLHSTWYELNVGDKVPMRLVNVTHDKFFHFNGLLLFHSFFTFISSILSDLLAAFLDSMVR